DQQKKYTEMHAAFTELEDEAEPETGRERDIVSENFRLLVGRYRRISQYSSIANLAKDSRIKVGGEKIDCYVLRLRLPKATHELWVDKDRFVILRHVDSTVGFQWPHSISLVATVNLERADLSAEPNAELFRFAPP